MIGVVLPYHKQADSVYFTVRTILAQREAMYVCIVDDGKTGVPDAVMSDLRECSWVKRFELIGTDHIGVQKARNLGREWMDHLSPDFILFSDTDILWYRGAFVIMEEALKKHPQCSYAFGDYDREGAFGGRFSAGPFNTQRLLEQNFVSMMSLIRMGDLPMQAFIEDEDRLQDWSLWLRMLRLGKKGIYVGTVLFKAFFGTDGISARGVDDYRHWYDKIRSRYAMRDSGGSVQSARA